jgi:hypothetical protein
MQLINHVKITKVALSTTAGTEVLTGAIDMAGYDGVMIFANQATHHDTGNYLKGQQCATSSGSYQDLEGSKVLGTADADVLILDIYKPTKRYVQGSFIRGGTNTVLGEIYILQYCGNKLPEANAGIYHNVALVSPAEGTA